MQTSVPEDTSVFPLIFHAQTPSKVKGKIKKAVVSDCFLFESNGQHILYSPLDKLILELDEDLGNDLLENQSEDYWKSRIDSDGSLGLFNTAPPSVDEYIVENSYDGIVLLMNNLCNMGCDYCYAADAQQQQTETIDENTWNQIVNYAFSRINKQADSFSVGFHGYGECTVEFYKIKKITALINAKSKSLGIPTQYSVTTNGTFSKNECQWMIDHGFRFNLSLDGAKNVNDLMRKSRGGKSLHHVIERNVKAIATNRDKCKLHVRATVTRKTTPLMVESLEYFANLGVKSVQFEPITPRGSAVELGAPQAVDMSEFTAQMKKAIERASELGISLRYGPLNFGIAVRFCSSKSKLTVDYKGRILSCLQAAPDSGMDFFEYGTISEDRVNIQKDKLDAINAFSVYDNTSCNSCILKYHCSGDCKAQEFDLNRHPEFKNDKCANNEELFAWCLRKLVTSKKARSIIDFELEDI